jgi:hypothetical protein
MTAVRLPLLVSWSVRGGADFAVRYRWTAGGTAMDFTTWTARLMARHSVGAREALLDWDDDHITLGADGLISIDAPAVETGAYGWTEAIADLDLTGDGGTVPFLRAHITVTPGIIR